MRSKEPKIFISKRKMKSLTLSFSEFPHGMGKYQSHIFEDNIPGYPGYHISNRGNVYSRWDTNGKGKLMKRYHKKATVIRDGRYYVKLSQPYNKPTRWAVSRLVALVYVPNPDNKPYVCHKDNNPLNNFYKNLYWGTQKENMEQASRDNRLNPLKGSKNPNYKGTEIQRSYIPLLFEKGFTIKQVSEILNLGKTLVRDYYANYRNNIQGTNLFTHHKRS